MNLHCPVCQAPIAYAYETRHCEVCNWQIRTNRYSHIQISDTDPVWIDSNLIPPWLRPGYQRMRDVFTAHSTFLSCALTLRQAIQQLIALPVLIGGSICHRENPDFSLPLSPTPDVSPWLDASEVLLARPEIRKHAVVHTLLSETRRFGTVAMETPFLPEGLLSSSVEPYKHNLLTMFKAFCQLLAALGDDYQKIDLRADPAHPTQFVFTMEQQEYSLSGVSKTGNQLYILTHILTAETASCAAIAEPTYDTMPCPAFLSVKEAVEKTVLSPTLIPGSTALMRRIHRTLDGTVKKGLLFLRTETEMGIPEEESEPRQSGCLTIVYDARRPTVNPAADLLETVSAHCPMDAPLLRSLEGVSSVSLTKLLTALRNSENRRVVLVVANADAYTHSPLPLRKLLPTSDGLPDGVWIVLHSASAAFSFPTDKEITLHRGDGDQSAFLFDYLQRHAPAKALERPAKRTERLAALVAAARGNFPPIYCYTAFEQFQQRPSARELETLNRPMEMFLQITGELYQGQEEALARILTLCETAVTDHTLNDLQQLLPTLNPWLIQIVTFDRPLLSRWHTAPLRQRYPDSPEELTDRYLNAAKTEISPRRLVNTLYMVTKWGTAAQNSELQSMPWQDIVHSAITNVPPDTDIQVLRSLYEAVLEREGITSDTCASARALLSIYEEKSDVSAWILARTLLNSDRADPLTQWAATVASARLLAGQGDDPQALTMLSDIPKPKQEEATAPEAAMLYFRAHLLRGEINFRQQKNDEAVEQLEQAFAHMPENALCEPHIVKKAAAAHILCADIVFEQKKYTLALPHYTTASPLLASLSAKHRAPEITQQHIHALMQAANCRFVLEQDTEALEEYDRAETVLLEEDRAESLAPLAVVYSSKAELFARNADPEHALQERAKAIDCLSKLHDTGHAITLVKTLQKAAQDALNLEKLSLAVRYLDTAVLLHNKLVAANAVQGTEWLEEIQRQLHDARDASDQANPIPAPEPEEKAPPEPAPEISVEEVRQQIRLAGIALQAKQYFAVIDTLLPLMTTLNGLPETDCLEALQNISLAYIGAQRAEEGIQWLEMLAARTRASAGQDASSSDTLAYILSAMGMVYRMRRREEQALESYSAAIDMWQSLLEQEKTVDVNHFASACVNRSVLLSDRNQYARAIEDLHRAIRLREKTHTADPVGLARLYLNLGYVYGQSGETEQALQYNHKALALRESLFVQGAVSVAELARTYLNIGILYGGEKQVEQEVEHYGAAIAHLQAVEHLSPEERALLVKLYRYRAMSYQTLGQTQEQQEDIRLADRLDG